MTVSKATKTLDLRKTFVGPFSKRALAQLASFVHRNWGDLHRLARSGRVLPAAQARMLCILGSGIFSWMWTVNDESGRRFTRKNRREVVQRLMALLARPEVRREIPRRVLETVSMLGNRMASLRLIASAADLRRDALWTGYDELAATLRRLLSLQVMAELPNSRWISKLPDEPLLRYARTLTEQAQVVRNAETSPKLTPFGQRQLGRLLETVLFDGIRAQAAEEERAAPGMQGLVDWLGASRARHRRGLFAELAKGLFDAMVIIEKLRRAMFATTMPAERQALSKALDVARITVEKLIGSGIFSSAPM